MSEYFDPKVQRGLVWTGPLFMVLLFKAIDQQERENETAVTLKPSMQAVVGY